MTSTGKKQKTDGANSAAPKTKPAPKDENALPVPIRGDETMGRAMARTLLRPSVTSALTIRKVTEKSAPSLTVMGLVAELSDQCAEVSKGNLGRPEAMLTTQAHTLDALFHDLTQLAYRNLADSHFDACERLFKLAFRAQGQSRATIETLGNLKNPPMFAKQANISNGPQQVNNGGFQTLTPAPAREIESVPNKLLEQTHGERLDTFPASGAGRSDTELETVGAINGAADDEG